MIIDCISDLHGYYPKLSGGDLLIVAGDLTSRDTPIEYGKFAAWIDRQKYNKKILISGNHDNFFENQGFEKIQDVYKDLNVDYLCDSDTEFEGLKIWGSPWSLKFTGMNPHCMAFTCDTDGELAEKWDMISEDTNILITHSPAWGMKDGRNADQRLGSKSLLQKHVRTKLFESLKLHVFGHIHEGYGKYDMRDLQIKLGDKIGCVYVNASYVNEYYQPVNKPIRIEL